MKYTMILPENFEKKSVRELLENDWLVPRKLRHFLRIKQHVSVNGHLAKFHEEVKAGDAISLSFDPEDFEKLEVAFGNAKLASILYEDEHLVIANKPEGMKTHGNAPGELALQNHVAAALGVPVFVVHRLDRESSGAVLFAKNQFILPILGQMLEARAIHREYLALVAGHLTEKTLTIRQPIGHDRHDKRKRVISAAGQPATTHIELLKEYKKYSLVHCTLETGRTHQIRVHLASIGRPISGDPLYGDANGRLMLHAYRLNLHQPFTKEKIEVAAPSQSFDERLLGLCE